MTLYEEGSIISIKVASGKSITAGSLVEMTDDFTGRDNETHSSTQVIGVALVGSTTAGTYCSVITYGVVTVTAGDGGITAGKTVVIDNGDEQQVEDGTGAGTVIGRALETIAHEATGKILLGHC
jgi:hypothetical protein